MRRSAAAAFLAAATVLPMLTSGTAIAVPRRMPAVAHQLGNRIGDKISAPRARAALERAERLVGEQVTPASDPAPTPSAGTLAMRDLFAAMPDLSGEDRRQAREVLARPTDGPTLDPDGYRARAHRRCAGHFCLHWVTRTDDRATSRWVTRTMRTMNAVWRLEVDRMGYRRPVRDGRHGGNNLFDVYLKDLGAQGLYGYCTPEYRKPGRRREASGYCVLDNDFARSQFGTRPVNALRVTAAHEFFHAIQFGYDFKEDSWLLETTATWMEERFADAVNDNRQYLRFGQVAHPGRPLDLFNIAGYDQYGNWPFFEFLSSRYGARTVRQIWTQAGEFPAGGHRYSIDAVQQVLKRHGGLKDVFTWYAAGNVMPARTYAEGDQWPANARAQADRTWTLARDADEHEVFGVRHLASQNVVLRPGRTLRGRRDWQAVVGVDGPAAKSAPAAYAVVWKRGGGIEQHRVRLDRRGHGTIRVGFNRNAVKRVVLTLANASTRFDCRQGTNYSCRGVSRDARDDFDVTVTVRQR